MKLPVVNDRGSVSWTPVIGKKIFHQELLEKIKFENFDFQNQNKTEVTSVKLVLFKSVMSFETLTKVDQLTEIVRFG